MIRKGIYIIFFLLLSELLANAQNLSVESFRLLESDLTANTYGTLERDQNGEVAALIKIVTSETGFAFDGGMMGIVKTTQKTGEIWVYVPHGIQKITISHQQLGVLRDYYFPVSIEKARTYELILNTGNGKAPVVQSQTSQFVVFKVQPQNAVVFIDDDLKTLDAEGMLSLRLPIGTHSYSIMASSFVTESGVIEVDNDKITKEIILKSAQASLTIKTAADAEIWINEENKGFGEWSGKVEAGVYLIESRKPSHHTSKQEITLGQQEERTVFLEAPMPMYGTLEIVSSPIECKVYLDGKYYDSTPFSRSDILVGKHLIRIEKTGYVQKEYEIIIEEGLLLSQDISLDNSHDFVDLGLSVKWATCNIGAENTEDLGKLFSWGELEDKEVYNWSTYANVDDEKLSNGRLNLNADIVNVNWGGGWRMPTKEEFEELLEKCSWKETVINGTRGYKITSKVKGYKNRSIFLPASGCVDDKSHYQLGICGHYWSSSTHETNPQYAWALFFDSTKFRLLSNDRYMGFSVRPVRP